MTFIVNQDTLLALRCQFFMLLTQENIQKTQDKVKETVDKLNSIYGFNMKIPKIYFDVKGTNAGLAKFRTMSVHFNEKLAVNNWEDFIDNTVPHEVCHLAVWQRCLFLRKKFPSPHGATWKLMMSQVGAIPKRTHDYDVSEVRRGTKRYEYDCGCDKRVEVSAIIHNRITKGRKYKCNRCNNLLVNGQRKFDEPLSEVLNKIFNK